MCAYKHNTIFKFSIMHKRCGHIAAFSFSFSLVFKTALYKYGVARISRLLKFTCLFCKRALSKRRYSTKETYNFKEPTNRSHPVSIYISMQVWMCAYTHTTIFKFSIIKQRCGHGVAGTMKAHGISRTHISTHNATCCDTHCNTHCNTLQRTLQRTATRTATHTAAHCNTLQSTLRDQNDASFWDFVHT